MKAVVTACKLGPAGSGGCGSFSDGVFLEKVGVQSGQPHEEGGDDDQATWRTSQANAHCVQNPVEDNSVVLVRSHR